MTIIFTTSLNIVFVIVFRVEKTTHPLQNYRNLLVSRQYKLELPAPSHDNKCGHLHTTSKVKQQLLTQSVYNNERGSFNDEKLGLIQIHCRSLRVT